VLRVGLSESGDWAPLNGYAFVLYDTGEVIVHRDMWKPVSRFFSVTLTSSETETLLASLRVTELLRLDDFYDLAEATSDLGVYRIEVIDPKTSARRAFAVRGWLPQAGTKLPMAEEPPPPAFLHAFQQMSSYSHPREQEWFPASLEIDVYERPGQGGCPWPADWADLGSPGSERLKDASRVGRIRETGTRLAEVQRFLEKCQFDVDLRGQHVQLRLRVNLPHQVDGS